MLRPLAVIPWRGPASLPLPRGLSAARGYALGLVGMTLTGLALRLILLARFPLREDEALYASWALHALHEDPHFLTVWPDKPPLFLWLLAGLFSLTGPSAAAARWLSVAASVLMIPVVAAGARRLWGSPAAGQAAGLLYALNPFAISFAATVYTDSWLVLFGTLALVMALRGRALWAGVWLGAAVMTKQQGLLYLLPVSALVCIWAVGSREIGSRGRGPSLVLGRVRSASVSYCLLSIAYCLLGLAVVVLPILWWDSTRWAVAPSPWDLATRTYAPLTLAAPALWGARSAAWGELVWYLAASPAVWLAASLCFFWSLRPLFFFGPCGTQGSKKIWRSLRLNLSAVADVPPAVWIVLGWGVGYLLLHVFTTVQVWDRYLLPLAPVWVWAPAWPVSRLTRASFSTTLAVPLTILLTIGTLSLIPPASAAGRGALPIGGDHGDYAGLEEAMAWVERQPGPQVLYHQTLGWQARFYLYDAIRQGKVELRWFSSPVYLADNAAKTPYPPLVLILPDWAAPSDLALHLAMRGLSLRTELRAGHFTVYTLAHRPQAACGWCVSVPEPSWPRMAAPAGVSPP